MSMQAHQLRAAPALAADFAVRAKRTHDKSYRGRANPTVAGIPGRRAARRARPLQQPYGICAPEMARAMALAMVASSSRGLEAVTDTDKRPESMKSMDEEGRWTLFESYNNKVIKGWWSEPSSTLEKKPSDVLVKDVLEAIKDTDNGADMSPEDRRQVDSMLNSLEEVGDNAAVPPLSNPTLFGNYDVTYVSSGGDQKGNPAGGRFRSGLGKMIFRTTELQQNLYAPDVVVNKVGFRFLGFIPGQVTLTGTIEPEPTGQEKWVRARFESPKIAFFGLPPISVGPTSSVVLATTYLDEKVRLGKGSRGSLFVFSRTREGQDVLASAERKAYNPMALACICAYALCFAAYQLTKLVPAGATPFIWGATALVAAGLAYLFKDGGILNDGDPAPVTSA